MGSLNLPAMIVPGKLGLVQLKLYSVPAGGRVRAACDAAADHPVTGGNCYMNFRSKPVRQVAHHGEPPACIQQITDWIADHASLSPSTGLSSLPLRVPSYTKVKVELAPLLMGFGKAMLTVALGPRSPLSVVLAVRYAIHFERVVQLENSGTYGIRAVKVTRAVAFIVCWAGSSWALIT